MQKGAQKKAITRVATRSLLFHVYNNRQATINGVCGLKNSHRWSALAGDWLRYDGEDAQVKYAF